MSLTEKIRAARQQRVTVGAHTFVVQRPTDLEMLELNAQGVDARKMLRFLVGWEGVKEIDLIPGGAPVEVPFDLGVATEWLGDRIDILMLVVDAVLDGYAAHQKALADAKKD